jgi:hypothetical protein
MAVNSKELILYYRSYVKAFKGVEDFGEDKRKSFTSSFIGKTIHIIRVNIFLFFAPKSASLLKKYIFEGFRYNDIIDLFEKDDYSVIVGVSDLFQAIKKRQSFIWGGGIIAAFELALYLDKYKYLDKIINRLNLWNDGTSKVFLFLYEDKQPLGVVLSKIFYKSKNITTICIAHGYYLLNPRNEQINDFWDGGNCNFNFVWNLSQKKFFNTEKTSVILLGLPYQFNVVSEVNRNRIILLGHSGPEENINDYFLTYSHMKFIYELLKENNFSVKFKPHPQDKTDFPKTFFGNDIASDLYREFTEGSIFVGFNSSSLYEAMAHGLHVIGLDSVLLAYDRGFMPNKSFKSEEYIDIPSYLASLSLSSNNMTSMPLEERFNDALSAVENNLKSY